MTLRKLNLGCGFDKRPGFVNADNFAECEPDVRLDIESPPWPFQDGEFDHILMKHVLEHVGADLSGFKRVMRELYRVLAHDGVLEIHVPHFRHDTWWSDPTHVRAFTPLTFRMMSRRQNDEWMAARANYTMLAYLLEVDFEMVEGLQVYDPAYAAKIASGEMSREAVRALADRQWGVVKELQVKLRAVKRRPGHG